jgi:Ca-activated chloride channel family protein
VIVMIDASYSMGAVDVAPTRLHVAKQTAKALLDWQPRDVLVGVVAFGNHAHLVQAPTPNRTAVRRALDKLELQSGSALGTGLLGSLITLFPEADLAGGYDVFGHDLPRFAYPSLDRLQETSEPAPAKRVRTGGGALARIVVLSDGQSTHGVPLEVARALAAKHGVQLLAVGIGTSAGATVEVAGQHYRVGFDENNLIAIASGTGGAYWRVTNRADLAQALPSIQSAAVYEPRVAEISVYFAALGVCLLLAAAFTSVRPRIEFPGNSVGTT